MPPERETRKAGPVSALPSPLRWRPNQAATRASTRPASRMPLSCPPAAQSTATGAPFAAIARAIASAWSSGKRESSWPCTIRAGTVIRSATADGLRRSSSSRASASGFPAAATRSYMAHSSGWNRPHTVEPDPAGPADPTEPADPAGPTAAPGCIPPAEPVVKNSPAHSFLNTPCGNKESARFQYVICGAIASTRRSYPAASSETAPPYEAPATPTRGSPAPSSRTSGRVASQSMSRDTSLTSYAGSFSPICPPERPKPRADHVSTAYPSRASRSAWARTSFLLPPKPWPRSTAGRFCAPPEVKYEVSIAAPGISSTRSSRCTAGAPPDAAAVQVPAPATTASAAAPASRRLRRRRGSGSFGSRSVIREP